MVVKRDIILNILKQYSKCLKTRGLIKLLSIRIKNRKKLILSFTNSTLPDPTPVASNFHHSQVPTQTSLPLKPTRLSDILNFSCEQSLWRSFRRCSRFVFVCLFLFCFLSSCFFDQLLSLIPRNYSSFPCALQLQTM